ncbi:MAG: amino acid permease, partial [Burkholderiaceae bacterium]
MQPQDTPAPAPVGTGETSVRLRRVLGMPMLIFYGVGVTIGAGIFALIGEIVRVAGDSAPLAFLVAGLTAGATGISYALLSAVYPRAGGEAVYVNIGLGRVPALIVGYGVVITAIISSAVISIAFSGYLGSLVPVARPILVIGVLLILSSIACLGVRESVTFAAIVTLLEVGTLVVVAFYGAPLLGDAQIWTRTLALPADSLAWSAVFSSAVIAFFAFVGFEDLVNMAEETINPGDVMPRAIVATVVITVILYVLIATIAVAMPDREALTSSAAPLAVLFESVTGYSGTPVSAMASIAMINGILVQIVMASRVIYGMSSEGLAPKVVGVLHSKRRTPIRAILLVTICIGTLALGFELVNLA